MRSPEEEQATNSSENVLVVLSFPKAFFCFVERLVHNVLIRNKQSLNEFVRFIALQS